MRRKYLIDYKKLMLKLKAFSFYHSFLRRFWLFKREREREREFFFFFVWELFFDAEMEQRLRGLGEKSVLPIGPAKTQGKQLPLEQAERERGQSAGQRWCFYLYHLH
jgi:hypothetical protein